MLKNKGVEEARIGGGRAVAHSFMSEHVVDYKVSDNQTVAFGVGTPVFGDTIDIPRLKLLNSYPLNNDALRLRYQVLRDET